MSSFQAAAARITRPTSSARQRSTATCATNRRPIAVAPVVSAKAAGLVYVNDQKNGLQRRRHGKGFSYVTMEGKAVRDRITLGRIRSLAIPPAWTDVWICANPHGHLQAIGRDARGRKQYRYHPRWHQVRGETKYGRMIAFGEALPRLRTRVDQDLALPDLPREKVLATIVRLLETTLIRVGNEEYARENRSFGLTTLRARHVDVTGTRLRFEFRGKSGVYHQIDVTDRRLARIVKRCQELPGQELFQYVDDDGQRHRIDSADVNEYIRAATGLEFTAKDFRTWAGTVLAARALQEFEAFDSQTQAKKNVVQAIEAVARRLGNTRTVCRKSYIHPLIFDAYLDGTLAHILRQKAEQELSQSLGQLPAEEAAVLAFLQQRLKRDADGAA